MAVNRSLHRKGILWTLPKLCRWYLALGALLSLSGCGAGGVIVLTVGIVVASLDDSSSSSNPPGRAVLSIPARDELRDAGRIPIGYQLIGTRKGEVEVEFTLSVDDPGDGDWHAAAPLADRPPAPGTFWWDAAADIRNLTGDDVERTSIPVRVRGFPANQPGGADVSAPFRVGNTPPQVIFRRPPDPGQGEPDTLGGEIDIVIQLADPEDPRDVLPGFDVFVEVNDPEGDSLKNVELFFELPGGDGGPVQLNPEFSGLEPGQLDFRTWDSNSEPSLFGRRFDGVRLRLRCEDSFGTPVVVQSFPFLLDNNRRPEAELLWFFGSEDLDRSFEIPIFYRLEDEDSNHLDVVIQHSDSEEFPPLPAEIFNDRMSRREVLASPGARREFRIATPALVAHPRACEDRGSGAGAPARDSDPTGFLFTAAGELDFRQLPGEGEPSCPAVCDLSSSPAGEFHLFLWDSARDLDPLRESTVWILLTPFDDAPAEFPARSESSFLVDNDIFPLDEVFILGTDLIGGVAAGDIDGDGLEDLALSRTLEGVVEIYFRDPGSVDLLEGPFRLGRDSLLTPQDLLLGDLNGSGRVDLAVLDPRRGTPGDGNILVFFDFFETREQLGEAVPQVFPAGDDIRAFSAGDFDGENGTDLVVSIHDDRQLGVFRQGADGTFAGIMETVPSRSDPGLLACADFDRDGIDDVVVRERDRNRVSLFRGSRSPPGLEATPLEIEFPSRDGPVSLATGDFNGDALVDLAVGTREIPPSIFVFYNQLGETGQPGELPFAGTSEARDQRIQLLDSPEVLAAEDLTGDGRPDLIALEPGLDVVELFTADGSDSFRRFKEIDLEDLFPTPPLDPNLIRGDPPPGFAVTDFDGDGNLDFIIGTSAGALFFPRERAGSIAPRLERTLLAGDLGSFRNLLVADCDADGLQDVVALFEEPDGGGVAIFPRNRLGGFPRFPEQVLETGPSPQFLAAADRTASGAPDLLVVAHGSGVDVFARDGGGRFPTAPTSSLHDGIPARPLFLGEFDGEEGIDVVRLDPFGNRILISPIDGGRIEPPDPEGGVQATGDFPLDMATADIDCDGRQDLAVFHDGGEVEILLQQAAGRVPRFSLHQSLQTGSVDGKVHLAHLDGDARVDLLVVVTSLDGLLGFNQDGDGVFRPALELDGGLAPFWPVTCDFNGDGLVDIGVSNFEEEGVGIYYQRAEGFPTVPSRRIAIGGGFSGGARMACEDITGDSRPELVIVRPDGSEIKIVRAR